MSMVIGEPLEEGFDRLTDRNGLVFVGVFAALSVVSLVLAAGLTAAAVELAIEETERTAEDVPDDLHPLLGEERERIPEGAFTRKLGWALFNLVVGGVVFGVAVGPGPVLVLPGVFLAVSLFVWVFPVVLDDRHFLDSFCESGG